MIRPSHKLPSGSWLREVHAKTRSGFRIQICGRCTLTDRKYEPIEWQRQTAIRERRERSRDIVGLVTEKASHPERQNTKGHEHAQFAASRGSACKMEAGEIPNFLIATGREDAHKSETVRGDSRLAGITHWTVGHPSESLRYHCGVCAKIVEQKSSKEIRARKEETETTRKHIRGVEMLMTPWAMARYTRLSLVRAKAGFDSQSESSDSRAPSSKVTGRYVEVLKRVGHGRRIEDERR
ncbi:hypothetical protein EDD18DRAFT_1101888 [Armillaria luteobubalina]|uniref:Uncharacterized protein n=1 Tax=Armillaria luteobubalina TaxID=153913 RepID=A0AA39QF51_9AGAR|nr:hypothetical protein EDD18DRAFT_1101888 [Armillaria luteobubalina]